MFNAPTPFSDTICIGTLAGLEKELEKINLLGWQATEEEILSWDKTEGYPVEDQEKISDYNTESLAKFAYSILYQALKFAKETNTCVILDS